jgi:hypothetical protein
MRLVHGGKETIGEIRVPGMLFFARSCTMRGCRRCLKLSFHGALQTSLGRVDKALYWNST